MYDCYTCGEPVSMPYECNYCGEYNCPDHRLPEAHDCDGVKFFAEGERWFQDKSTGDVVSSKSEIDMPEPIEPKYTVGTRPEPDYESSPPVELKSEKERADGGGVISRILRRLFG
jgi:hypothetical protein